VSKWPFFSFSDNISRLNLCTGQSRLISTIGENINWRFIFKAHKNNFLKKIETAVPLSRLLRHTEYLLVPLNFTNIFIRWNHEMPRGWFHVKIAWFHLMFITWSREIHKIKPFYMESRDHEITWRGTSKYLPWVIQPMWKFPGKHVLTRYWKLMWKYHTLSFLYLMKNTLYNFSDFW